MSLHIKAENPYSELRNNPYVHPEIFTKNFDFKLKLIEENPNQGIILFRKDFDGTADYAFVVCRDGEIAFNEFQRIYLLYREYVKKFGQGDFKEVEPVIIARSFSQETLRFVATYNNEYWKRKPFRLFTF